MTNRRREDARVFTPVWACAVVCAIQMKLEVEYFDDWSTHTRGLKLPHLRVVNGGRHREKKECFAV